MPADTASSTAYWISGLSTTGIISLGLALVAGRKREPSPATGNTAFFTCTFMVLFRSVCAQQSAQLVLDDRGHAEFPGLVQLGAGFLACHYVVRLAQHRPANLAALRLDEIPRLVARERGQHAGEHESLARPRRIAPPRLVTLLGPVHARRTQLLDRFAVVRLGEELADAIGHDGAYVRHLQQRFRVGIHQCVELTEVARQILGRRFTHVADA